MKKMYSVVAILAIFFASCKSHEKCPAYGSNAKHKRSELMKSPHDIFYRSGIFLR